MKQFGVTSADHGGGKRRAAIATASQQKRGTRAAAQIPIKSAVEEMISISSMAPQLFLLRCNEHFASKNLKVDTVLVFRPQFVWWVGFVVQSLAGLLWAQKTHRPVRQRDKASS
jgi:hypothetical protein